jgi:hypothetical protein|tara:strand:+ start:434 stop:790 length:357 start_codon:yes stop_codon:yes gene_type:complete
MIHIHKRLMQMLPALDPFDVIVVDNGDGDGPKITQWNSPLTRPSDAAIASEVEVWSDEDLVPFWEQLRQERDQLISETDWWGSSDNTMSDAQTAYRQALRDLPANTSDPQNPTWPTKP